MEKITVLLPKAEVEHHIINICDDSIKFDIGRGLAHFDKINVLPDGPPKKVIFLRQGQENNKPIGYVYILPVRNNSIVKFVTESPTADFDEFTRLVTKYFQDLNLLTEIPAKPVEAEQAQSTTVKQDEKDVKTKQLVKTSGEYSVGFFLEFAKGKTPKNLFILIACTAYLKNPSDIGAIGLMGRVYTAVRSTLDELNAIKQINPDTPGIANAIRMYNENFPILTAKNITEGEILRELAIKILNDFTDVLMGSEQNKHFFNNSELIPIATRAIIEQIQALSIDEAGELLALMPLVEKWKKDIKPVQAEQAKTTQTDLTAKPEKPQDMIASNYDDAIIRFGTDKNLSRSDVKGIVKRCNAFVKNGGKVAEFHRQHSQDKYELETLRKWLKDSRFTN